MADHCLAPFKSEVRCVSQTSADYRLKFAHSRPMYFNIQTVHVYKWTNMLNTSAIYHSKINNMLNNTSLNIRAYFFFTRTQHSFCEMPRPHKNIKAFLEVNDGKMSISKLSVPLLNSKHGGWKGQGEWQGGRQGQSVWQVHWAEEVNPSTDLDLIPRETDIGSS